MESDQELLSMDSHDSEDSDGSSIVIRPISYSQFQERTCSGTNSKQRYILQSSDISSSDSDAQKETTTSSEQKRSKSGNTKRPAKRTVVPSVKSTTPSATVSVPKKTHAARKKTSRKSTGKRTPSVVSQETPSSCRAAESIMRPLSSGVPVTTPSSSAAPNQMSTGPDHEAELEEVPPMPEETSRSRDLQGVSHFIQISLCVTTEKKTKTLQYMAIAL